MMAAGARAMNDPLWMLDESQHAGSEHLDAMYVADYDAKAGTDWSEDIAEFLALGIGSDSTIVDLGAGTGSFALAIAPQVGRVIGVDISEAMVREMRARGLEAVHAGFLSYEHQGPPPDAVFTRNALHQLPDFWKVIGLHRIASLLRPGGVFRLRDLVFSFDPSDAAAAICRWLDRASTDPAAGWTRAELAAHVRDEYSTFTWLLEPMLDTVGFEVRTFETHESGMYASYTCVRR